MFKDEPFSISVNGGQHEFAVLPADAKNLDVAAGADGRFHILKDGKSWHAELVEADHARRVFVFRIAGNRYEVNISDHYERLVQQLGMTAGAAQKAGNAVKAPMPGLVLSVLVEPGQAVQKGDALLILEAMKMENVIKAPGDATVKTLRVKKGEAVEKGQLLLDFQ